jgi:hypothetical protein
MLGYSKTQNRQARSIKAASGGDNIEVNGGFVSLWQSGMQEQLRKGCLVSIKR